LVIIGKKCAEKIVKYHVGVFTSFSGKIYSFKKIHTNPPPNFIDLWLLQMNELHVSLSHAAWNMDMHHPWTCKAFQNGGSADTGSQERQRPAVDSSKCVGVLVEADRSNYVVIWLGFGKHPATT
jgi:hypothetical protein